MKIILMTDEPREVKDPFFDIFRWENFQAGDMVWLEDWDSIPEPCAIVLAGPEVVYLWPATYAEGEQAQTEQGHYTYTLMSADGEQDDLKVVCKYWTLSAALRAWQRLAKLGHARTRIKRTVKNQGPYDLSHWFYTPEGVQATLDAYQQN